jgi:hypothetical protein
MASIHLFPATVLLHLNASILGAGKVADQASSALVRAHLSPHPHPLKGQ